VSSRTRRGSIENTKTEIWVRIKSIKGTSTVIKSQVKIKTRRKRRIEVGIMILVLITQRNTMKKVGNLSYNYFSSGALGKL
jgi:succinyl-CoA synthetase beta subunit